MYTNAYIDAYVAGLSTVLLKRVKNICSSLKKGKARVSFEALREMDMLMDLLANYKSCMTDSQKEALFNRLRDLSDSCNITVILPPLPGESAGCDDNSLITEDGICIVTEDTGDPVVREDIPNIN